MADRHLRHHLALTWLVTAASLLCACTASLESIAAARGIAPQAIVRLAQDRAVAARLTDGGTRVEVVDLFESEGGGWTLAHLAEGPAAADGRVSVNLGTSDRAFVYGSAPPSASRVLLPGADPAGGQVTDGAWVAVVADPHLGPDELRWEVVDATGHLLQSGTGLTNGE